jgi:hypothetical protein
MLPQANRLYYVVLQEHNSPPEVLSTCKSKLGNAGKTEMVCRGLAASSEAQNVGKDVRRLPYRRGCAQPSLLISTVLGALRRQLSVFKIDL